MSAKKNGEMTSEVVTITPSMASEWLALNKNVRVSSPSRVRQYAAAMKRGEWELTGDAVKFDSDEKLVDGQNRLNAIIVAGKPVRSLVVRGASGSDVMDTGLSRSSGQLIVGRGYENGHAISAALRLYILWGLNGDFGITRIGGGSRYYVDNSMVLEALDNHKGVADAVDHLREEYGRTLQIGVTHAHLAVLHYAFSTYDETASEEFIGKLAGGLGIEPMTTMQVLRERLIGLRNDRVSVSDSVKMAYIIKCWNTYIGATPYDPTSKFSVAQCIKFGYKESYPLIAGVEPPDFEKEGLASRPKRIDDISNHANRQQAKALKERREKARNEKS